MFHNYNAPSPSLAHKLSHDGPGLNGQAGGAGAGGQAGVGNGNGANGSGGAGSGGWRHPSAYNSVMGVPQPPPSPGYSNMMGGMNSHNQGAFSHVHSGHGGHGPHPGYGHAPQGSFGHGGSGQGGGGMMAGGMHGGAGGGAGHGQPSMGGINVSQMNGNGMTNPYALNNQNSPPPGRATETTSTYWSQQVMKADACRQSSAPHHRARASALASRMVNQKTTINITDPNRPASAASNAAHRKVGSVSANDDHSSTDGLTSSVSHPSGSSGAVGSSSAGDAKSEPWTGIDLGGIRLRTLTPSLFAFTHITTLYINHNALTYLAPAISNLRHLTHLDATGNQLMAVPVELGLLSCLKELLLFDNNIQELPMELGTLFQLEFLGIEGNPISENLRILMSEKGTQGLIRYWRDNCPLPAPPMQRKWEVIQEGMNEDVGENPEGFSIFSFNVLCERAATPQMYGYTPSWALEWPYRRDYIMQEITENLSDVICLQEVDDHQYHELFSPRMAELGYEGAFNLKTRARTMTTDERRQVDGCATFWKKDKYTLVERRAIEFNQVAMAKAEMKSDAMYNRIMSKDNIAVVCILENKQTDTLLIVANVHIHYHADDSDVKLVQVAMLVEETEKIAHHIARNLKPKMIPGNEARSVPLYSDPAKIPLIICGDFNSMPNSAVYEYLTHGSVPADHRDFLGFEYGQFSAHGLAHRLALKSAYGAIGELPMTNYTPGFVGPIDFIWYTHPTMAVTSVLGEVDKNYLAKAVGFPNAHFPSDHIPIGANFTLKPAPMAPANSRYR